VKLVYTTDSKSVSFGSDGSSPSSGTSTNNKASAHAGALLLLDYMFSMNNKSCLSYIAMEEIKSFAERINEQMLLQ
ncbi:hypothetical protein, partial [Photobacterium leiognathi]|uniref:hypothetical protein n=1 Tax=Photobacterium leiognathi TaxID=553611 RepID=UPI002982AC3A